jgi:mRNA interferase MazF
LEGKGLVVLEQGQVYWLVFAGRGSEPDGRRPAVVVQHDRFNRSAISTTVVAAITSNRRLAAMPGNVALRKGEANLPRASVVNVSQLGTIDRARLTHLVGKLSARRFADVLSGIGLVFGLELPTLGPA